MVSAKAKNKKYVNIQDKHGVMKRLAICNPVQESVCNNFSDTGVTGLRAVWLIHLLLMFPTLLVVLFVVYNIYYNELLLCSHCYQCYYYYEQSLFVLLSVLLCLCDITPSS